MSGFSLHPTENDALLETRVGDPATRDLPPAPGFLDGALGATGRGLGAAYVGTRLAIDTAAQYLPDSFFEDDDKPLVPVSEDERRYGGIRSLNAPNPAVWSGMLQDLRPDPQTTGTLGQITYGVGAIIPPAIAGAAVGGPLGAALTVGTVSGVSDYQLNLADGLDENTAQAKAVLTGGFNAAGVLMPASLGTTMLTRIGSGAALNVPLGMAQRGATAELLRANGYEDMAEQYKVFSGVDIMVDAITGAAFGALPNGEASARPREFTARENVGQNTPDLGENVPSGNTEQTQQPETAKPTPTVLPSDIDFGLSANAMSQFEIDAAPGVPTTPAARNGHIKAMDTAYQQLMRNEPVEVTSQLTGEMLPKPENNPLNQALNEALEEGGYNDLIREGEALRGEAEARGVPLGEDLVAPEIDLDTGDLLNRTLDPTGIKAATQRYMGEAASIREMIDDARAGMRDFKLFNRNSSQAVQKMIDWPTRPVPLMEWVASVGGIRSGLSVDEAADMRARGVKLTDYYTPEVKELFDGRKGMMNKYVKHDGLGIEDDLPTMAAEQGYLGAALQADEYRMAHQDEAQQKFYEALKKGIAGKAIYDNQVEEALDNALSRNQAAQALEAANHVDATLNDLSKYGLTNMDPTVAEIAEALARRQAATAPRVEPPTPATVADEYDGIPFMRAPAVQEAFPRPVDAEDVNPLGFYSQLARVAEIKLPNRGDVKDFIKALDAYAKNGDFKPEELEYSGVKEWLSTKDYAQKDEVIDFMKYGGVTLQEVTLSDGAVPRPRMTPEEAIGVIMERQNLTREQVVDEQYGFTNEQDYVGVAESLIEDDLVMNMDGPPSDGRTKYSRYTLPGGENYREVLLTLPTNVRLIKAEEEARIAYREAVKNDMPEEQLDVLQSKLNAAITAISSQGKYTSSHWDQPNVLAHFRLADFKDAEGNPVLMIEEIQSDWHQEGRRKGYSTPEKVQAIRTVAADWNLKNEELRDNRKRLREAYAAVQSPVDLEALLAAEKPSDYKPTMSAEESAAYEAWQAAEQAYTDHQASYPRDTEDALVPDAPFKKTWAELSFKRILRMAAEKGYKKVAWTTGEMQAERFDLSKQISKVEWLPTAEGMNSTKPGVIRAWDLNGRSVMDRNATADDLPDIIGKEVAQKIVNSEQSYTTGSGKPVHMLEGLDLKVGGEGMKGFYDDILPKTVGKVIGKLDKAAKVGTVKTSGPGQAIRDRKFEVTDNGDGSWQINNPLFSAPMRIVAENRRQAIIKAEENYEKTSGHTLHGFDLTDELRERVMMGLPQFYRANGDVPLPEGLERVAEGLAAKAPDGMTPDDYLVAQQVNNTVARMLPGAEVRMAGKLFSTGEAGAAGEVFGAYRRPLNVRESRGVVDWSLAAPDAVGVARHEVLHGLKETGLFKPEEWDALTAAARTEDWIGQAKLPEGYKPEQLLEEAIAERFRIWRREAPDVQVRGVSGIVYTAFSRLNRLLERVGELARQFMGLKPTTEDVFNRIERGEVGQRETTKGGDKASPTYPVTAAEQMLADMPDVRIPAEDGGYVDGKLAMTDADADAIRAEQFGPLYEVAVNCFQRG